MVVVTRNINGGIVDPSWEVQGITDHGCQSSTTGSYCCPTDLFVGIEFGFIVGVQVIGWSEFHGDIIVPVRNRSSAYRRRKVMVFISPNGFKETDVTGSRARASTGDSAGIEVLIQEV